MSVNSDESKRLKAILKVGEEPLVTHKGDSEDSLLKSFLGAGNSNQEFVNHKYKQSLGIKLIAQIRRCQNWEGGRDIQPTKGNRLNNY